MFVQLILIAVYGLFYLERRKKCFYFEGNRGKWSAPNEIMNAHK